MHILRELYPILYPSNIFFFQSSSQLFQLIRLEHLIKERAEPCLQCQKGELHYIYMYLGIGGILQHETNKKCFLETFIKRTLVSVLS